MTRRLQVWFAAALLCVSVSAQTAAGPAKPLTLDEAVTYALAHYPAVRASLERLNSARAGVAVAQTNYLPSANALWQANRATHNNIFGLLLPQGVVPSISGPVLPDTSNAGAWGSAAGVLVSWEPLDFGYRRSLVQSARDAQGIAAAQAQLTRLDVASAAVAAFLNLAAAQQTLRAAQANVDRRQVFIASVHALVQNELRPGAEESRANTELAAARIRLIQAETAEQVGRAALADLLSLPLESVAIDAFSLLRMPPAATPPSPMTHPNIAIEQARAQLAGDQLRVLDRSYVPRFNLQTALSGRGSGANLDGTNQGGASGLDLQRQNWAIGLTATFPVFDIFSIRARRQVALADQRAQQARVEQVHQDVNAQAAQARASAEGARRIAEATPVELKSAQDAEAQARARYQAGLTTVIEVSDAEALLVQAEIDDAVAKLIAWRSLAALAAAQGSLDPFLEAVRNAGGH